MKFFNYQAKLLEKRLLVPHVYYFKYEKPADFSYLPGQYIGITTHPTHRRCYSVFESDENTISFIIDVKPGGLASQYFESAQVGDAKQIIGPYGRFFVQKTTNPKIFIGTGSGAVPFISMINEFASEPEFNSTDIKILFGARYFEDDYAVEYLKKFIANKFEYIQCITKPDESKSQEKRLSNYKNGRVTKVISEVNIDFKNTEFYICGNPDMVNEVSEIVKERGGEKIYVEKYA